jgi:eukaryotic-like serine/threonine-protein kinase
MGLGDAGRLAALGPGVRLGRYELRRELGRGGMGIVFEAHDPRLGRLVALKVLSPQAVSSPDARKRFLKEGQTAVRFEHKHVVTIYDLGEEDGFPFLVMEYLDGETLAARLGQALGKRLPVAETLTLLRPVCDAVAAAHEKGIVHRDLKPDNIFLVKDGAGVRPVVLDFGIAKALGGEQTSQTATGQIVGTPRYMSPEQAGAVKGLIGAHTDQYALGVIVYECVAGQHPLGAAVGEMTVLELLAQIVNALPEPLLNVAPDVGAPFSLAVMRMLAKVPDARFSGVREAKYALDASVGQESVPTPERRALVSAPTMPLAAVPPGGEPTAPNRDRVEPAAGSTRASRRKNGPLLGVAAALAIAGGAFFAWRATRPALPAEATERVAPSAPSPPSLRPPPETVTAPPAVPAPAPPVEASSVVAPPAEAPLRRPARRAQAAHRRTATSPLPGAPTTAAPAAAAAPAALEPVPLVPDVEARSSEPGKTTGGASEKATGQPARRRANDAPDIR